MPDIKKISELRLEQYALGELGPEEEREIGRALENDQALRGRLEALRESDREILRDYPPQRVVPAILERAGERPERARIRLFARPMAVALPIAAVALLFLSVFVMRERLLPDQTRLKGEQTHLSVFRKTAAGIEELSDGARAGRSDVLQLSYSAGDAVHGVIFSVDGRGTVTWHLPAGFSGGAETAPFLEHKGQVVLPLAYELDDAPGFERFFLVSSRKAFSVEEIDRAARALASNSRSAEREALSLSPDQRQFSLILKKQGRAP